MPDVMLFARRVSARERGDSSSRLTTPSRPSATGLAPASAQTPGQGKGEWRWRLDVASCRTCSSRPPYATLMPCTWKQMSSILRPPLPLPLYKTMGADGFFFFFAKDAGVAGSRWASQRYSFLFPERGRSCTVRQHTHCTHFAPWLFLAARTECSPPLHHSVFGSKAPSPFAFPALAGLLSSFCEQAFSCLLPDPNTTPDHSPSF